MKVKKYVVLKWLFRRYQEGSVDQQQKEQVDEWFGQYYKDEIAPPLRDKERSEQIHRELSRRLSRSIRPKPVYSLWPASVWLKAACVLAVVLPAGWWYTNRNLKPTFVSTITYDTIITGNRQVKKITLEDGTEIWLNAATKLRVATSFKNEPKRLVYLDKGEAFFKVRHDASRPFEVISGHFITRDIGTSFNIRAYDLQQEYRVSVVSGKVDVVQKDGTTIKTLSPGMTPGQVLVYDPRTATAQLGQKDTGLIQAWTSGGPVDLDGLTLTQIGGELSRHFDIRVEVMDPEADQQRYPLKLGNQNIKTILHQLTLTAGISYRLEQDHLIINPINRSHEIK